MLVEKPDYHGGRGRKEGVALAAVAVDGGRKARLPRWKDVLAEEYP